MSDPRILKVKYFDGRIGFITEEDFAEVLEMDPGCRTIAATNPDMLILGLADLVFLWDAGIRVDDGDWE